MRSPILNLILLLCLMNLASCYNDRTGKRFGAYSYAAYCSPDRISKWDVG